MRGRAATLRRAAATSAGDGRRRRNDDIFQLNGLNGHIWSIFVEKSKRSCSAAREAKGDEPSKGDGRIEIALGHGVDKQQRSRSALAYFAIHRSPIWPHQTPNVPTSLAIDARRQC
jgi:hypothetical protein